MNTIERINKILEHTKLNGKSFSKKIGLNRPQAIYDIQKGRTKNISHSMANKIMTAFSEFNKVWLITGEGQMLNNDEAHDIKDDINVDKLTDIALFDIKYMGEKLKEAEQRISLLEKLNESYRKELNELKSRLN